MEITCKYINDQNESIIENQKKVKYLLPNEKAIINDTNTFIIHEKDVTLKSSDRVKIKCPIFYECGGCDYLHMSYDAQMRLKADYVKKLIEAQGIVTTFLPMIKSDVPLHYRHKVVATATTHKKRLAFGLYREHSRQVIPFTNCFIQDKDTNEVIKALEILLNQFKIPAYDVDKNQGIVKHVLIRKSYTHQSMLVCIVTQGNLLPNAKKIAQNLVLKFPKIETVVQNIHHKKTHLVLLDEEKTIYGSGYILDQIEGISFRLSARSFYQVNPMQMISLYKKAIEAANIKAHETVLDTYSGIGTLSLLMAKKAKHVIGVEVNQSAHQDALQNKKFNQIQNIEFVNRDVQDFMMSFDRKVDLLMMDPTREGASKPFIDGIKELKPTRIIYVSCEPKTLARDLALFKDLYDIKTVQPVDMFSQTVHVESITLLSLK